MCFSLVSDECLLFQFATFDYFPFFALLKSIEEKGDPNIF